MTATINTSAVSPRTFNVRVEYDTVAFQWATVESQGSQRKTITVDLTGIDAPPFTIAESDLYEEICGGVDNRTCTITESQAIMWREMRRKIEETRAKMESTTKEITHVTAVIMPPATTALVTREDIADLGLPVAPVVCPETHTTAPGTHVDVAQRERERLASTLYGASVQSACSSRQWRLIESSDPAERIAGFLEIQGELKNKEFWVVRYDIPTVLQHAGICPSPCDFLRSLGCVHTDGSGWHATLETLRSPEFSRWVDSIRSGWKRYAEMHATLRSKGRPEARSEMQIMDDITRSKPLVCRVEPLDKRLNGNILRDVIAGLDTATRDAHTRLIETIAKADESLAEALASVEGTDAENRDIAEKKRIGAVRTAIASAVEEYTNALKGAEQFDCTMDVQDLLAALRSAVRAHAQAFNARYRSRRTDRGGFVKPAPSIA